MSNLTDFWTAYEQCCNELVGVQTVDEVMRICKGHFGASSEEAFFPGGCGDQELLPILLDAGWNPAWTQASYFFAIRQPDSREGLTYIEGDLARGIQKPI
jgi:hypothetical protein